MIWTCDLCGKEYEPKKYNQRYCRRSCLIRANNILNAKELFRLTPREREFCRRKLNQKK